MFTSRPSDPRTVLLWGDRWHFPGREASAPFTHVKQAAAILAEHFAEEPKPVRVRLVFQPDSLESVQVSCPQGNRKVLEFALAADYAALREPEYSWGHEPVLPDGEGFLTILHHETEPVLIAMARELARLGLAVDSAWPLTTFLHALPEEWTDSGAVAVVAVRAESGIAYHHPAGAGRFIVSWRGDAVLADAGHWLATLANANPEDPVILVCDGEETAAALGSHLGEQERPNLDVITVSEALGRRVVLPRYHPAQLLPRESVVTVQRAAIAASIALFFAAGWAGFAFGRDTLAVRAETAAQQSRTAALRTEVSHLRENAAEIASLRNLVEDGAAGPPCGSLLRAVSTALPPEIVLSSIRIEGRRFEFAGWVAPIAPAGLLDRWRQQIAPLHGAWTMDCRTIEGGAFVATGAFRP